MKKRILGLALALIMIISLLPMTTLAADVPMPKLTLYSNGASGSVHSSGMSGNTPTVWFVLEDVHQDDDPTKPVIGNKFVKVTAEPYPTENFLKFRYVKADEMLTITFNNINYTPVTGNDTFFTITNNGSHGNSDFDITIDLQGTNVLTSPTGNIMKVANTGTTTITGTGSLTATSSVSNGALFQNTSSAAGSLVIKDTTLSITNTWTTNATGTIVYNGQVTIDNSNVTIRTGAPYGIVTSTKYSTDPTDTTKGITVKNNSTLLIDGIQDGETIKRSGAILLNTAGPILFENSNVELHKGEGNHNPVFKVAPTITGAKEVKTKSQDKHSWSNYSNLGLNPGDLLKDGSTVKVEGVRHFKATHEHEFTATANDCTAAKACACGATEAGNGAHAGVVTDCTKDTMCTNAGCQQVYKAKVADTHEANADDNNCTTAVTCKHCTTVTTPAETKHKDTRTDCSVAGTCGNTGCTHAFAAGEHNPEADDNDCTTAIKCATCGKQAKAGEAAHKYTDKNDTTCDNAGCTNTRKVDGTENPKTGDNTALVLCLSLMMAASAAFVCTKKFAR